ncbi:RNA polymerase II-associated protein 3 isoform X1 [Hylaeus anthracinus]|uniref:RNA polymerase II-associated protein 3 isoform X1 n=2 Tax=Hylaeus anthracinus TaxID=313031 RepID=UPI0023B9922B|nr:RNA polymerase II-associated protein 3 isoform X1 [Hylaeus anthracinus]XP_054010523.1 RNA polymerase II-associated protein 3 isoform X1 [Hylaeus anthracinus]
MDKSIFMQKQVKDNAEDLQKEFLDMKNWEQQMKSKDEELRKEMYGEASLPPIRSKNRSKTKVVPTKQNGSNIKSKRIKSYDHSAWDKFDADEACKNIDKAEQSNDSEDEIMSKEELEKAHRMAVKYKNQGNIFVQQQKWVEAIGSYNQAIKTFPYDAVFYANRALCQLKLDNLCSAESDCSAAIQLDETYVKAYHRRATARMNLKQYKEAKQDLEKVLKLEPSNKEAKLLLAQIESKIQASSSASTSKENTEKLSEKSSVEKLIGEKMWSSTKSSTKTTNIKDVKDSKEGEKDENSKDLKHIEEDTIVNIQNTTMKYKERDPRIPDWLPEKDDVAVIEPVKRPPHLRSKKSLLRIPVEEVEFSTIQYCCTSKETACNEYKPVQLKKICGNDTYIPICLPEKDDVAVIEPVKRPPHLLSKDSLTKISVEEVEFSTIHNKERTTSNKRKPVQLEKISKDDNFKIESCIKVSESVENVNNIPPVPRTAVQFVTNWKTNKSSEFRYKYLKQLPRNSLPLIFQNSMESDIFSEILEVLKLEFIKRRESIYPYLKDLSEVKRFRALIMFISNDEKRSLKDFFEYCKVVENISFEEIEALQENYEISK